jgi:hypothetical protein
VLVIIPVAIIQFTHSSNHKQATPPLVGTQQVVYHTVRVQREQEEQEV